MSESKCLQIQNSDRSNKRLDLQTITFKTSNCSKIQWKACDFKEFSSRSPGSTTRKRLFRGVSHGAQSGDSKLLLMKVKRNASAYLQILKVTGKTRI